MEKFERFLNKFLGPIANYMAQSKFFGSLAESFMRVTPITLGAAVLMIIGNFPNPAWSGAEGFLVTNGLAPHFDAVIGSTMGVISLYVVFNFAYTYANKSGYDPLSSGLIALASFFIIMPQKVASEEGVVKAYQELFTGGTGLFVAILTGAIVGKLYVFLNDKNFTIKMPDSVPSNVSKSLSPSLIAGVIFAVFFIIRLIFAKLPGGSVFYIIFGLIQQPLQTLTASPISIIVIFTIANLLWFFGIHPNMVYGVVYPMLVANVTANVQAYLAGEAMPFVAMSVVSMAVGNAFGGQGATYGFVISSFTAKSERYKSLRKLAAVPSIFNINEPIVLGAPRMLNPMFFFPMVFGPTIMWLVAWFMYNILSINYNPLIGMPWTTPSLITTFLQGGFQYMLIPLVLIPLNTLIWYPFFRVADNRALKEEQA